MLGVWKFRHPPQAILVLYVERGVQGEVFADWRTFIVLGASLLLFSALVWLPFVHHVTRSLRVMANEAELISEGGFQVHVASARGDEIGRLRKARIGSACMPSGRRPASLMSC